MKQSFLPFHLVSKDHMFDSIETGLEVTKVTGQIRDQKVKGESFIQAFLMIPNPEHILVRNFLVRANNGDVSIHQLTGYQMPTLGSNAKFLTAFVSHNMSERKEDNIFNGNKTYFDSNNGTTQRILTTKAYNFVHSANFSPSHELIPFSKSNWDNVEDNKLTFVFYQSIKDAVKNANLNKIEDLWKQYETFIATQVEKNKLVRSSILIAKPGTLAAGYIPFSNTQSSNAAYNAADILGSERYHTSWLPKTCKFTGSIIKTTKDSLSTDEVLSSLVKPNFEFGLRNIKLPSMKSAANKGQTSGEDKETIEFNPDINFSEQAESVATTAVFEDKKMQSFSSLVMLKDSTGNDSIMQLIVSDMKRKGYITKRSKSFSDITGLQEMFVVDSVVVPRSLNVQASNGHVGKTDQGLVGSLAIIFELEDITYSVQGSTGGITSNSVDIDTILGSENDLEVGLESLGNIDEMLLQLDDISSDSTTIGQDKDVLNVSDVITGTDVDVVKKSKDSLATDISTMDVSDKF